MLAIHPEAIAEAISTFLLIAAQATRACKGLSQSNRYPRDFKIVSLNWTRGRHENHSIVNCLDFSVSFPFSPCYQSRETAEPTILIPSINYRFYRANIHDIGDFSNIWNENNIMDNKTDSVVENFKFPRVYNGYSLTRFLERFRPFVSKSLNFVHKLRSLNFTKSSWILMISCRTTRYIATIYKKYPSIFPFLFFFFFLYSINSRYVYTPRIYARGSQDSLL